MAEQQQDDPFLRAQREMLEDFRRRGIRVQGPPSTLESGVRAAGQYGAGINRGITGLVGAPLDAYDWMLRQAGVAPLFGSGDRSATDRLRGGLESVTGRAPDPENAVERFARGAGEGTVDAASMLLPAAAVARRAQAARTVAGGAPQVASRTEQIATSLAAQPALQGAAGAVGGGVAEVTGSPLAGMAASLATPMAVGAGRRVFTPTTIVDPERAALAATLRREGVPVPAGQATGNPFLMSLEASLETLPTTAANARNQALDIERAFTRAALARAGHQGDNAGPPTLVAIRNRLGREFNDLSTRHDLDQNPALMQGLSMIVNDVSRNMTPATRDVVLRNIEAVLQSFDPATGLMPGARYRAFDSELGRLAKTAESPAIASRLGALREALRAGMDDAILRSGNPEDVARWQEARTQYANLMTIARAMEQAGASTAAGRLSPTALWSAVGQSTGEGGRAFGRSNMDDLARAGQGVLRPVPNSGTPQRSMANSLLTAGALGGGANVLTGDMMTTAAVATGALALPPIAQAAMNSPLGRRYLTNQMLPPQPPQPGVRAGIVGAQVGGQTDQGDQRRLQSMAPFLSPRQRAILGIN